MNPVLDFYRINKHIYKVLYFGQELGVLKKLNDDGFIFYTNPELPTDFGWQGWMLDEIVQKLTYLNRVKTRRLKV